MRWPWSKPPLPPHRPEPPPDRSVGPFSDALGDLLAALAVVDDPRAFTAVLNARDAERARLRAEKFGHLDRAYDAWVENQKRWNRRAP